MRGGCKHKQRVLAVLSAFLLVMTLPAVPVKADPSIGTPSAILVEASTGRVIYEKNSTDRRSPASVTKIMTLLLTFEQIEAGKVKLTDDVLVSEHASGMGGSQVYLAQGEVQTLDTMIKCIAVSSGNDASVAVAEHIAGSEDAFVEMMNEKAAELGMKDTHFVDCCGLTDSDNHYSTAKDVAIMSRELITKHPAIFQYTMIWMEDITHVTKQGEIPFTLSSTNKLLKQYQYTTGLKTGSTSKAKFCMSATANKDGLDMIAVVMGAETGTERFQDAQVLLNYGFSVSSLYVDTHEEALPRLAVQRGVKTDVGLTYQGEFRYLDIEGNSLDNVEKVIELPESVNAPVSAGTLAGQVKYLLNGAQIGQVQILFAEGVAKATYRDYLKRAVGFFLL
ncbi:MAG: D-alanyl-D-alanine carboxypeptidase [Butyrivibrio sp.]|nr:D-alanyl-D-alanine carboxypeptidase [Muribaculum sp.]MCM1553364.1 D-alanyl-D-alanine carboxypeptidase [Butyrivibrio sp.]